MKKSKFLSELEKELNVLSKVDRNEIIEDYKLHIEEGVLNGETEEKVIKSLGLPSKVALESIEELGDNKEDKKEVKVGFFVSMQVLNLLVGIWIVYALFMIFISFLSVGLGFFSAGVMLLFNISGLTVQEELFSSFIFFGFGFLFTNFSFVFVSKLLLLIKKYIKWNKSLLKGGN